MNDQWNEPGFDKTKEAGEMNAVNERTNFNGNISLYFGKDDYSLVFPLKGILSKKSQKVIETMLKIREFLEIEGKEEKTTLAARTVVPLIKSDE